LENFFWERNMKAENRLTEAAMVLKMRQKPEHVVIGKTLPHASAMESTAYRYEHTKQKSGQGGEQTDPPSWLSHLRAFLH
jgi:hypothetical protein